MCYTSKKEPYCLNVIYRYILKIANKESLRAFLSPPGGAECSTQLRDSAKKMAESGSSHMAQRLSEEGC